MPRAYGHRDSSSTPLLGTSAEVPTSDNRHCRAAEPTTVVYATPLADPGVLLAVPVTSGERQLSCTQAPAGGQGGGISAAGVVAVAPAVPLPSSAPTGLRTSGPRLALTTSAPHFTRGQRICEVQEQRDVCFRQGTRMCQLCKRWVCSEHASDLGGTLLRCQACARGTRGSSGAQRCECVESRCQTLLCILVCIALFVLFYLGPYRDGRK